MAICKNCGAQVRYDPESKRLVCDYCLSSFSVSEYEGEYIAADETQLSEEEAAYYQNPEAGKTWQVYLYTCPSCGGQLLTYEETAATFCSFCGASVLLESRVSEERRPDIIIPFSKTKQECEQAYKKMLKKAVFAPSDMKKDEKVERFRGIYMPYWVYSFHKDGQINVRGRRSHRSGDYIINDNFDIRSDIKADIEGLAYDASSSFSDSMSEAIAPFDYSKSEDFDPGYISGFYADTSDTFPELYIDDARSCAKEMVSEVLLNEKEYSSHGAGAQDIEKGLDLEAEKPVLALFPVWFLASRNKKGDRVSYAVVNGQTAKAAADLPVDKKKLLIGTLILAIPVFLILNALITMTPSQVMAFTFIFDIIACVIANRRLNLVYTYENRINDKGYQFKAQQNWNLKTKKNPGSLLRALVFIFAVLAGLFVSVFLLSLDESAGELFLIVYIIAFIVIVNSTKKRRRKKEKETLTYAAAPMKSKIKVLIKPVISIVIAFFTIYASPVSDIYYYAACIASLLLVMWCFWDILGMQNKLASRPIAQFEKRGGQAYEDR